MEDRYIFVLAIIAIAIAGGIIKTWIKAKHGYAPDHGKRRKSRGNHDRTGELDDARKVVLLTGENERLTGQVGRLEDRIAVLERIVTDPAQRLDREIESLRTAREIDALR